MIKVVAAVIEKDGKFLICKRGAGGNCAFLWEFPGGKIEDGESPNQAVIRECEEELGIKIEPTEVLTEYSYSYPEKEIYFYFIGAKILSGEITLNFHQEAKWITPKEKDKFNFCPADISAVEMLCKI